MTQLSSEYTKILLKNKRSTIKTYTELNNFYFVITSLFLFILLLCNIISISTIKIIPLLVFILFISWCFSGLFIYSQYKRIRDNRLEIKYLKTEIFKLLDTSNDKNLKQITRKEKLKKIK